MKNKISLKILSLGGKIGKTTAQNLHLNLHLHLWTSSQEK